MERTDWTDVKKRLKKAVDQGMKVLKEGTQEAKYMAHQTSQLIQLEVDVHRVKSRIETLSNGLGKEVHKAMKNGRIAVTPAMKKMNDEILALEKKLRREQSAIHHTSIVRRGARK